MLSILIPIYNDSVVALVAALHQQCLHAGIAFEIICLDDGSRPDILRINAALRDLPSVQYEELPENLGRSRIRNRLAEMAQYPFLLFSDGDAAVVRSDYIQRYLPLLQANQVIYGGRVYSDQPPPDATFELHWRYGNHREALPASVRTSHPYRTFMTNNFVVPHALFQQIRFDESIVRYGYEDTLYALELQRAGVSILHIDNPLEHLGLETHEVFLRKIDEALDNLLELSVTHPQLDTRLLATVRRFKQLGVLPVLRLFSPGLKSFFAYLLKFDRAPLRILDLYKLFYFVEGIKS